MVGDPFDARIEARITRRIAARTAHRATGQQDEATLGGVARRVGNRADVATTRLVANVLDLFGADDKAQDFRTIAQGTEDTMADARTLPGKVASVAGYVAPQAMATVLGARGLAAAGEAAGALGAARTAKAIQAVAGAKGAGILRRNVGGALAAAPLITVPGALSDDPSASTVGVLAESLPERSMLGKAARTVAATKAGRLAADLGIDVLAGSALEGAGHGVGAAGRAVGRRAAKALDVSEGMVEAGAKAAGDQVDEAAARQGAGFAEASDDAQRAAQIARDSEAKDAARADALAKLEETKLEARHAAMERDALKAKPKALPPSPDEATRYDVETYKLNRDRNAGLRAKVRADWEAGQEPTPQPTPRVAPPSGHPVTAEEMLAVGKQRAAELDAGIPPHTPPDLRPAMEREGRMFGDIPSRGTMFDVGGAVGAGLRSRFGESAAMGATGAGLQQSDDEKIKATGTGLMALAAVHAVGLPRIKAGAGFVGKEVVERMKQSPLGVKVLNGMSHDILADPEVKTLFSAYQDAVAKGRARAAELSKAAKALGPSGDRAVSDAIEREAFEPLTGDQTAVLAVAQRISDEFTALGRGKVEAGLLAPATVAKREGQYLPRVYAEHLGESATDAAERVVKQTTRKPRIVGDKARLDDLSDAARNALGEVREASFRTAYGLDKGYRDIAAAKLFAGLREMPGVVHPEFAQAADALAAARQSGDAQAIRAAKQQLAGVSKMLERAGGDYKRLPDTPGMGILRGAVVRADVAAYMDGIPAWGGKMGDLYTFWKRVHTVMNPGTHVGNTASNSVVAHMSGLPIWQQPKALKQALADYNAYGPSTKYLAELGILERGLPTMADAVPVGGRKMSTALTELSETTRPETARALAEHGITPRGRLRRGFDKVSQKMESAYSKEDGVFRVATFNRLVADGMEPRAAADYVDRAFVNYQTRSPLLGAIKNTVSPFILYPAKAIPFVAGQIVEHPWRWATLAAAWGAMDQYSQKKVGEIAQADLRPDQRVNTKLGYLVPGFTQLPFTNEKGDRYGIDVARWTPFSAITGAPAPGSAAMALGGPDVPGIVQPSGPFLDIGARLTNTDPFTGQKLVKPGDDFMDKAATVVKGAASLALPSAASFHLPRVVGDLRNADPKAAAVDALGLVGAKPSVVRPGVQRAREVRAYEEARRNIVADLRFALQRAKSPERKRALEARAREKLIRLAGPMQELATQK